MKHPQYLENILYIGGDTYSGIPHPMMVEKILNGDELISLTIIACRSSNSELSADIVYHCGRLLQGYVLGNPKTDDYIDDNSRVPFAHRMTLISNELYKMLVDIDVMQILEPLCKTASSRPVESMKGNRRSLEDYKGFLAAQAKPAYWCREYNYVLSDIWANNKDVRAALGVRKETKGVWMRCNGTLDYTKNVPSTVPCHRNLTKSALRALIYSGDHDLSVTHIGTQNWISSLNLTVYSDWRPWFIDGQIAGYTVEYINNDFTLDYATVKEYKPKECYEMIDRWLAYYPV
ncbi:hypothetical protein CDL15_Pgr027106 [Punica granatum]|uniref:Serine carboxypeptidase-like 18 n=1 Tax=Punica granatum TaxID=22663 RepID=A0A218XHA6_PUNGR|nr:hypothetical protein CDL15_Pgr027106 [Punica granatum]